MSTITSSRRLFLLVVAVAALFLFRQADAQEGGSERLLRVTWQDAKDKSLHWGEYLQVGPSIVFQNHGKLVDFPALEAGHQLGPMERVENVVLMGVRGADDGMAEGGWIAINLQVIEEPHGDHSDYTYGDSPTVLQKVLDDSKKCPVHLYVYGKEFYLANDSLNGFTRVDPVKILAGGVGATGVFYRGGGDHITLAAAGKKVAYSTWAGKTEAGKGKIDVVDLGKTGEESVAYSLESPSAGLHGAIANSGRIFLAPSDGVIWVDADLTLSQSAETVKVNHLSLGTDPETQAPYRTGGFTEHKDWVLFLSGAGTDFGLTMVHASAPSPSVTKLVLPTTEGLRFGMPNCVTAISGKNYAFAFQSKSAGELKERLTIIDLDPNQDKSFVDAKIVTSLEIGDSRVEGYSSYHSVSFDDDKRFAVFTNPAEGEICLLSLDKLNVVSRQKVGGIPTKIIAAGGEESKH